MRIIAALALVLAISTRAQAERGVVSEAETGERLYLHGLLASGEPAKAVVQGDIEVTGPQLSCANCHGRSGMGSIEGRRVVPAIAAPFLDSARPLKSRERPPYTEAELVRAIRDGVDSAGNRLDPLMPRYRLGNDDATALARYLKRLSAVPSAGMDARAIHLATVVTPGVTKVKREAMLRVLQAFIRAKSANAADHRSRQIASWPEYYGEWVLHVWELKGPASTWERQLRAFQRKQPVFAMVSGLGNSNWEPVQRFCEEQRMPCLLPNLDTPPALDEDLYSLYFSGGALSEADAIAAHLVQKQRALRVLQVVPAEGIGRQAAARLQAVLEREGKGRAVSVSFERADPRGLDDLQERVHDLGATAVVLWLDDRELAALVGSARSTSGAFGNVPAYLSSTLLDGDFSRARALAFEEALVAQPFASEREAGPRFRRVESWLASQKFPDVGPERRIADQTFFALTVLSEGVMHLKKNYLRDYLLEAVDHFSGFENFSSYYPRLSFGPSQRVLSKGCYLISLRDESRREWVVP